MILRIHLPSLETEHEVLWFCLTNQMVGRLEWLERVVALESSPVQAVAACTLSVLSSPG
jgi:hypothetical protein